MERVTTPRLLEQRSETPADTGIASSHLPAARRTRGQFAGLRAVGKPESCDHTDAYGSTIIMGPGPIGNEGDPVCILCDQTFPLVLSVVRA